MGSGDFALAVQEIEGTTPVRIELRGGAMIEVGAGWESEARGSVYTPLGAREGYSTVTGLTYGTTEMTLQLDGAFLRRGDIEVENVPHIFSVEELHRALESVQQRGRECLVAVGDITRRGVLRSIKATPGRAYGVDFSSGQLRGEGPGLGRELVLRWEWSGTGELFVANPQSIGGTDAAGQLGGASAKLGAGLAGLSALDPGLAQALGGAIGRLRKGVTDLRKSLKRLGDLARLPARTAHQLLGVVRSVGNLVNDARTLIADTTDDYKAIGESARGAAAAVGLGDLVGPTAAKKAAAKRAAAAANEGVEATSAALVAILDAIARRKPRTVRVRPGQSLADIAREQLGSADRWPEIAEANGIDGQTVPAGTYQIEIPPKGS